MTAVTAILLQVSGAPPLLRIIVVLLVLALVAAVASGPDWAAEVVVRS